MQDRETGSGKLHDSWLERSPGGARRGNAGMYPKMTHHRGTGKVLLALARVLQERAVDCNPLRGSFVFKFLMSWDIQPGREWPYEEFMLRNFLPAIKKLGLEPSDFWYTLCGDGRQILMGCTIQDRDELCSILDSETWRKLEKQLSTFVENYTCKAVALDEGSFQM